MKTWSTSKLDKLANAFLGLDKKKDMGKFLRDLCTLEELEEMSSRWEVVEFLHKGLSYRDVSKKNRSLYSHYYPNRFLAQKR